MRESQSPAVTLAPPATCQGGEGLDKFTEDMFSKLLERKATDGSNSRNTCHQAPVGVCGAQMLFSTDHFASAR